jgi:alkaline phosphatase D
MRLLLLFLLLSFQFFAKAQSLFVSGPMAGYVNKETANIWVEAEEQVEKLSLYYWADGDENNKKSIQYTEPLSKRFNTAEFSLEGLTPGTTYHYTISAIAGNAKDVTAASFKTQPAQEQPDFSFLTGSCASNANDTSIFTSMANTPADFMLWLGDNWYLPNKVDRNEILWQGANFVRRQPVMHPLWKAMAHYAIWDDHDYGPNNSDKSFELKEDARKAFIDYWANPSYGEKNKGIYTMFSYGDVNFYLLDDRWWRDNDNKAEYVRQRPNKKKLMFGKDQMKWLKDELKNSKATFNIIATGSQVLNMNNKWDCLYHYPVEYYELLGFLEDKKIRGVIFLSGDRHHSEVIRHRRNDHYTLYDVTISPFTSMVHKVGGTETGNPQRIDGTLIEQQNYGKITITGPKGARKLHLDILGLKGEKLAEWEVSETELHDQ